MCQSSIFWLIPNDKFRALCCELIYLVENIGFSPSADDYLIDADYPIETYL